MGILTLTGLCLLLPAAGPASNAWLAEWIWWPGGGATHVLFVRDYELDAQPVKAVVGITADNRYRLYVNGHQVGQDDEWWTVERYEISQWLRRGRNRIGVACGDDGQGAAGLLVEGRIRLADGRVVVVKTDATWRCAKQAPEGWTKPGFALTDWRKPTVRGRPPMEPWREVPRPEFAHTRAALRGIEWIQPPRLARAASARVRICLDEPCPTDGTIGIALSRFGELVVEKTIAPDPPLSQWKPGQVHEITIENLLVPGFLPHGEYEVVPAGSDLVGAAGARVHLGPKPAPVPEVTCRILDHRLNDNRLTVVVEVAAIHPPAKDEALYVQLRRGKELWFAATQKPPGLRASTLVPGQVRKASLAFALPPLPEGAFELIVGMHRARSRCTPSVQVRVAGSALAEKPLGYGTMIDAAGVPHLWYINAAHTLIWDGEPYVPVGAMYLPAFTGLSQEAYEKDRKIYADLVERGVTDLYFNPCRDPRDRPAWRWQAMLDAAEAAGLCYAWQITMHLPALRAYHIEARDYLLEVPAGGRYSLYIPNTYFGRTDPNHRCFYALFDANSESLLDFGRAEVRAEPGKSGVRVSAQVRVPEGARGVLHFIPELRHGGDMHDYWKAVTPEFLDDLRKRMSRIRPGPGFRGFLDPLDNEQSWRDQQRMLPSGPEFQQQLAAWLAGRYKTLAALARAWAIEPAPESFEQAGRLLPVGKASAASEVGWCVDPVSSARFRVDLRRSQLWDDFVEFRDGSIRRFNMQVADAIKSAVDAPVILKLTELNAFTNNRTYGGFDAVGMEAYSPAPELVRGCGGGVYARAAQARRTIWELVTETGFAYPELAPVGYPDPLRLVHELGSMVQMGAKGTYVFLIEPNTNAPGQGWYLFNLRNDPRQIGWLGAFADLMKTSRRLVDYRPDVDFAFPSLEVGPGGFRRSEPDYQGSPLHISLATRRGRWVVPTLEPLALPPTARVIVTLTDSPASVRYASVVRALLAQPKRRLLFAGLRRDLGTLPIDAYYTDRIVRDAAGRRVQILRPPEHARITHRLPDGRCYGFELDRLAFLAIDDWEWIVRNLPEPPAATDFVRDVVGGRILDLGDAFQGLQTARKTFVWNMTGEPVTITIDGEPYELPPKAQRAAVVPATDVRIEGIDAPNIALARRRFAAAAEAARKLELNVEPLPACDDWRVLQEHVRRLEQRVWQAENTAPIHRLKQVVIDGRLDEWRDVPLIPIERKQGKDFIEPVKLPGTGFRLGWDEQHLYLAVQVRDEAIVNVHRGKKLWNGDAVELFLEIDREPDAIERIYDDDCYKFILAPTSADGSPAVAVVGNPKLPVDYVPAGVRLAVRRTADGYVLEAALPASELRDWAPAPGKVIGFNLFLGDSDGGDRQNCYLWRGTMRCNDNRFEFARAKFLP